MREYSKCKIASYLGETQSQTYYLLTGLSARLHQSTQRAWRSSGQRSTCAARTRRVRGILLDCVQLVSLRVYALET